MVTVPLCRGGPYPVTELEDGSTTSSELVQRTLDGSSVVKKFNTVNAAHRAALARPAVEPDRWPPSRTTGAGGAAPVWTERLAAAVIAFHG